MNIPDSIRGMSISELAAVHQYAKWKCVASAGIGETTLYEELLRHEAFTEEEIAKATERKKQGKYWSLVSSCIDTVLAEKLRMEFVMTNY